MSKQIAIAHRYMLCKFINQMLPGIVVFRKLQNDAREDRLSHISPRERERERERVRERELPPPRKLGGGDILDKVMMLLGSS